LESYNLRILRNIALREMQKIYVPRPQMAALRLIPLNVKNFLTKKQNN